MVLSACDLSVRDLSDSRAFRADWKGGLGR
jgi:hypothetical protein